MTTAGDDAGTPTTEHGELAERRRPTLTAAQIPGYSRHDHARDALRVRGQRPSTAPATYLLRRQQQHRRTRGPRGRSARPTSRRGTRPTTRSCARPSSPVCIPETHERPAQRHRQLQPAEDLLQQSTNYPGHQPGAHASRRSSGSGCTICTRRESRCRARTSSRCRRARRSTARRHPNGGGANRFSIRVGLGTNFTTTNGLHVYGNQKMGAYANATGANTQFYLTRVLPGEAGKTLVLNFFDTGDASAAGTLAVAPTARLQRHRRRVRELQVHPAAGERDRAAVGDLQRRPATGCQITGVSNIGRRRATTGSGSPRRSRSRPTTPATRRPRPVAGRSCGSRIPPGTSVTDTTTWSAYILGEPGPADPVVARCSMVACHGATTVTASSRPRR